MRFLPSIIIMRDRLVSSMADNASSWVLYLICTSSQLRLRSMKYCILKYGSRFLMVLSLSFCSTINKENMRQKPKSKATLFHKVEDGAVPILTHQGIIL